MAEPGELEFQASLIAAINEASPDGILVVDEHATIISHNQRFLDVWHISRQELGLQQESTSVAGKPDQPLLALVAARIKDTAAFIKRVKELYADPSQDDHCELELKDGRTLERHSTVLRGLSHQYLGRVWFFRDITERKRTEAALRVLAEQDPLTGVANRRVFFQRGCQELARMRRHGRPLSLIALDIDHFKGINDRHGHAIGDSVLKRFCEICRGALRDSDLLARLGGEEFGVILPETPLDGALVLAERLCQAVSRAPLLADGLHLCYTVSAGVTALACHDSCIDESLRRADEALYHAKRMGRNRVEVRP